jgi:hypothetical protein
LSTYKKVLAEPRIYGYSDYVHPNANLAFIRAKGSGRNNFDEASRFVKGGVINGEYMEHVVNWTLDYVTSHLVGSDISKISFEEVLIKKNRQSDPGYPYNLKYGKTGELVDGCLDDIVNYFHHLEKQIDEGVFVNTVYEVFSKDDKYGYKKIQNNTYRTIQNADLFLYSVGIRWLSRSLEAIKTRVPQFLSKMYPHEWDTRVWRVFKNRYTVGLDYTAWDRGVPHDVAYKIIYRLMEEAGASHNLAMWLASSILSADMLVTVDGLMRIVEHCGGNCSGQPFTTDLNQIFHLIMNVYVYSILFEISPMEVLERIDMVLCGDDELVGGSQQDMQMLINDAPGLVTHYFDLEAKVDSNSGKPYPPGIHACFLDQTTFDIDGFGIPVPVRTFRRLAKLWYRSDDILLTLPGVYQSLGTWMVVKMMGFEYPADLDVLIDTVNYYWDRYSSVERAALFPSARRFAEIFGVPGYEGKRGGPKEAIICKSFFYGQEQEEVKQLKSC